eukprot:SAG11_NODE_27324_length_334_cov_0.489362_1_plen_33_part_10
MQVSKQSVTAEGGRGKGENGEGGGDYSRKSILM